MVIVFASLCTVLRSISCQMPKYITVM